VRDLRRTGRWAVAHIPTPHSPRSYLYAHMTDIPVKKSLLGLVAVCCMALAGIAAAQAPSVRFGLGGGAIVPVGDYNKADKIGWHGLGMGQCGLPGLLGEI